MNFSSEALDLLATTASANRKSTFDDQLSQYCSGMMDRYFATTSLTSSIENDADVHPTSGKHQSDRNHVDIDHPVVN